MTDSTQSLNSGIFGFVGTFSFYNDMQVIGVHSFLLHNSHHIIIWSLFESDFYWIMTTSWILLVINMGYEIITRGLMIQN
ncbi:hypothetical protein WA026_008729 [Henosepilachna vigintioctopunctata]|uniref:Uncharacterized protein n=1 Tax=Henosepilachna vigintioctopunctata TaxID=420089 RepID=A0AAW1V8L1_9CUCU